MEATSWLFARKALHLIILGPRPLGCQGICSDVRAEILSNLAGSTRPETADKANSVCCHALASVSVDWPYLGVQIWLLLQTGCC